MTPEDVALFAAEEQLGCALQIIAALVLTDEEVTRATLIRDPEARPENMPGWAAMMKRDLLTRRHRKELVRMLTRLGFYTNTDAEFPLRGLDGPSPRVYYQILTVIQDIADRFAAGEFPDPPPVDPNARRGPGIDDPQKKFFRGLVYKELRHQTSEIGQRFSRRDIDYAMRHEGDATFLIAWIKRRWPD